MANQTCRNTLQNFKLIITWMIISQSYPKEEAFFYHLSHTDSVKSSAAWRYMKCLIENAPLAFLTLRELQYPKRVIANRVNEEQLHWYHITKLKKEPRQRSFWIQQYIMNVWLFVHHLRAIHKGFLITENFTKTV